MRTIALLLLGAAGCSTTAAALAVTTAQVVMEPYSFLVRGEISGLTAFNSRFLVRDGQVDIAVEYRGPDPARPGRIAVLWRKSIRADAGRRVYRAVFGADGRFLRVVEATWAEARASMPFLPE